MSTATRTIITNPQTEPYPLRGRAYWANVKKGHGAYGTIPGSHRGILIDPTQPYSPNDGAVAFTSRDAAQHYWDTIPANRREAKDTDLALVICVGEKQFLVDPQTVVVR